jgi:hypothetical protein
MVFAARAAVLDHPRSVAEAGDEDGTRASSITDLCTDEIAGEQAGLVHRQAAGRTSSATGEPPAGYASRSARILSRRRGTARLASSPQRTVSR